MKKTTEPQDEAVTVETNDASNTSGVFRWKVSAFRQDKRTGATSCVPMSNYTRELVDAMMRKWK
ncbi:hypothetical protein LLE49_19375 [Alicyclobacillus tolerans]|uniref:hypothetical protein n=1 Tax=Alicyclobacillus tolerans TaxID=90970 RepID=UPI001F4593F1|nr:hypothetical protein [Alicyclobacillus tolerans]MCF8566883.1 hypothetical protein [Alicyclobacillus tolerans]